MSKRLLIYCEGQTEEMFVNRLLRQHLAHFGVRVERPVLAATTMTPGGQRGGFVNWQAIEFDLRQLFAADRDPQLRFTTLLDVFRIPNSVPGMSAVTPPLTNVVDVERIERAMELTFQEPRFKAYLQRHEWEALLLADVGALEYVFQRHLAGIQKLAQGIASFANTEDINHRAATHPAARRAAAIPGYEELKDANAYFVLSKADFPAVRRKCPRFDQWLSGWEQWGQSP